MFLCEILRKKKGLHELTRNLLRKSLRLRTFVRGVNAKEELFSWADLYVDNFCICYRSKSMQTIERHLQECLNKIENWALYDAFKLSKSKTQCIHFCQLRNYMIILNYIYMDLSFQLLMKRNFLVLFFTENICLFLVLNI